MEKSTILCFLSVTKMGIKKQKVSDVNVHMEMNNKAKNKGKQKSGMEEE